MGAVPWPAIIAVLVGSSGLVGALTIGIQHSRSARLRRSIREALELADRFSPDARPAHALRAAAQLDAYRLAAMSLQSLPSGLVSVFVAIVVMVGIILMSFWWLLTSAAGTAWDHSRVSWTVMLACLGVGYVLALAAVADSTIRKRRDALVSRLLEPGRFTITYSQAGRARLVYEDGETTAP